MNFVVYIIENGKEIVERVSIQDNISEEKAVNLVETFLVHSKGYSPEDIYAIEQSN